MALADRLRQTFRVERSIEATGSGAEDDWGNTGRAWGTVADIKGWAQEKSSREVAQMGPEVGEWTIFALLSDVRTSDRLVDITSGASGPVYQLTGVRDPGGRGHHLELDATRVSETA